MKDNEIKIETRLLESRKIFLSSAIEEDVMETIIKKLVILDNINNKNIDIFINSPGGVVSDGFAFIDTVKQLKSKVNTYIIGEACSVAGLMSIIGNKRYMSENSFWMSHDMRGGIYGDYSEKVLARTDYIKKCWALIENHLKKYTKLNNKDLDTLRSGELWLNAKECLTKGIIDKII